MRSSLSSSAFTEFTIALPLYTRSPASIASGFDESICNGILTTDCTAFTASIISATSSPPGTPTFISSISAPDSSSSIATLHIYSISWFKSASWNLFFPVGFNLSPTTLTPFSSTISFPEHIPVFAFTGFISEKFLFSNSVFNSLINSGDVPQHPPAYSIPISPNSAINFAKSVASRSYSPVEGFGSPALGFIIIGRLVHSLSFFASGSISFGPREQLKPIASTPSPSSVTAIDSIFVPVKVLPVVSYVIVTHTGSFVFSFAASTPALTS